MTERRGPDTAQLGCGSLILIALLVLFLGQGGDDKLRDEVRQVSEEVKQLRTAVGMLNGKIDRQTDEIRVLRKSLEQKAKE